MTDLGPVAAILPCGTRLHLQHGPIDLIIGADGGRKAAFAAARARFATVLEELVAELTLLRQPVRPGTPRPAGSIGQAMQDAAQTHATAATEFLKNSGSFSFKENGGATDDLGFITPMVAVAGAVADTILAAMINAAPLRRAYVNNGGDIAIRLGKGQTFTTAMALAVGTDLGRIEITAGQGIGGIATSGFGGRSLSRGIADAVTVLAGSAAHADAAATLIANAVDLPDHPGILRQPARHLHPDSDLADIPVTVFCPALASADVSRALQRGLHIAQHMRANGLIHAAALFLQGQSRLAGRVTIPQTPNQRRPVHA